MKAIAIEDKGHIGSHTRIFTSNLRHDSLLFVSQNSDIKILNIRTGKFIGDIGKVLENVRHLHTGLTTLPERPLAR